jgi:BMFP domain-containing protein YqiC
MLGEIGGRGNRKIDLRRAALAPGMGPRHMTVKPASASCGRRPEPKPMPQTNSRFFDDLSRLMTDAAGLADGAKREAQTFARAQMERMMAGMNVVAREEFEAVKEMAAKARDENEKLAARVAALEAKLGEPRP